MFVGLTVVIGPVVELPLPVMMVRLLNTAVRPHFEAATNGTNGNDDS